MKHSGPKAQSQLRTSGGHRLNHLQPPQQCSLFALFAVVPISLAAGSGHIEAQFLVVALMKRKTNRWFILRMYGNLYSKRP